MKPQMKGLLLMSLFGLFGMVNSLRFFFNDTLKGKSAIAGLFVIGEDRKGSVQTVLENIGLWDAMDWRFVMQLHRKQRRLFSNIDLEEAVYKLGKFVGDKDYGTTCPCQQLLGETKDLFDGNPSSSFIAVVVSLAKDPCSASQPESCTDQLRELKKARFLFTKSDTHDRSMEWLKEDLPYRIKETDNNHFAEFPYRDETLTSDEEMLSLQKHRDDLAANVGRFWSAFPEWDRQPLPSKIPDCYAPAPQRSECKTWKDDICTKLREIKSTVCEARRKLDCRQCYHAKTDTTVTEEGASRKPVDYEMDGISRLRFIADSNSENARKKVQRADLFVIGEGPDGIVQTVLENSGLWYHLRFEHVTHFYGNYTSRRSVNRGILEQTLFELNAFRRAILPKQWECLCQALLWHAKKLTKEEIKSRKILVIVSLTPTSCDGIIFGECDDDWSKVKGARIMLAVSPDGDRLNWLKKGTEELKPGGATEELNYVIPFPFHAKVPPSEKLWANFQSLRKKSFEKWVNSGILRYFHLPAPLVCYAEVPSYTNCAPDVSLICVYLKRVPGSDTERNCTAEDKYCRTCFQKWPKPQIPGAKETKTSEEAITSTLTTADAQSSVPSTGLRTDKATPASDLESLPEEKSSLAPWAIGLIAGSIILNTCLAVICFLLVTKNREIGEKEAKRGRKKSKPPKKPRRPIWKTESKKDGKKPDEKKEVTESRLDPTKNENTYETADFFTTEGNAGKKEKEVKMEEKKMEEKKMETESVPIEENLYTPKEVKSDDLSSGARMLDKWQRRSVM